MTKIQKHKALVVDDERLARKQLVEMLEEIQEIDEIYQAEDVKTAKVIIEKNSPNIIFLDIQMPHESGFDLLEQINYSGKVIFVTAYDEYALRAFEVNAMDYLMKPVAFDRLKQSIERIQLSENLEPDIKQKLLYSDRLFLTIGVHMHFIKVSSIIAINSDGDYTNIQTQEGIDGLVAKSMNEWELRLPENNFSRIHRSTIINLEYIEKIEKWFNYSYRVFMKNLKEPLIISRRYAKSLKEKYG
jgi:two-component system, LytTR family, response regulator